MNCSCCDNSVQVFQIITNMLYCEYFNIKVWPKLMQNLSLWTWTLICISRYPMTYSISRNALIWMNVLYAHGIASSKQRACSGVDGRYNSLWNECFCLLIFINPANNILTEKKKKDESSSHCQTFMKYFFKKC